ncbi:MAG: hypothetical protein AAB681_02570, partial [Patescibacteria group bacterium]
MKRLAIYSLLFVSLCFVLLSGVISTPIFAQVLPDCIKNQATLKPTQDKNKYEYTDDVFGKMYLSISDKKFQGIGTAFNGSWQCQNNGDIAIYPDKITPSPTQTYDPKATTTNTEKIVEGDGTCNDGIDNSVPSDGKADYYGVDTDKDGILDLEPDPSCIAPGGTEKADISNSRLISCYNYCTFSDVLKTINNIITFLITTIFIPI